MIEVKNVNKKYKRKHVLKNMSFTAEKAKLRASSGLMARAKQQL